MRLPALNSRWMSLRSARWRGPSVSRIDRRTSIRSSSTSSRLTNLVEVNVSASLSTAQTSSYCVTAQKPEPMSRSSFQCTGSSRRNVSNIPHASSRAKASRSERSTSANGTGVGLGTAHSNRLGPNNKHVPHLAQGLGNQPGIRYRTDPNDLLWTNSRAGTQMTEVKGFFYPRTAGGRSSLIPSPPWYYSGDLLTVEYRTDPARVAELLPAPLELAEEDPGAAALIWADWQSCSSSREELLDPVRSQYKEAFVVIRCSFESQTYSRCVYIWVDKDFAIGRGIHQGYPKKLGSMWQTRPHPFAQGAPQVGAGGVFGATLAAGDRRLAEAVLTLREESETNGFVNAHKMAHHRIFPGIEADAPDAYAELIESGASEFEAGPAWTGDVELRLFDSPTEELSRLAVDEIIGGYYRQVGVVWNGGRSLATLTPLGVIAEATR